MSPRGLTTFCLFTDYGILLLWIYMGSNYVINYNKNLKLECVFYYEKHSTVKLFESAVTVCSESKFRSFLVHIRFLTVRARGRGFSNL